MQLNKCLSVQFNSAKYIASGVRQISRTFSTCKTETLYPLTITSPFPPPPAPTPVNHHPTFCFCELHYLRYPTCVESYNIWVFWRSAYFLSHSVLEVHRGSRWPGFLSFFKAEWYSILCWIHILFIHSLKDKEVTSTTWLLWITLPQMHYKCLYEILLWIPLDIDSGAGVSDHMVTLFLLSAERPYHFS